MESCHYSCCVFKVLFIFLIFFLSSSSSPCFSWMLPPSIINSTLEHSGYTLISDFRVLSRRLLSDCDDQTPSTQINVTPNSNLSDDVYVTVTITGILVPEEHHWVAMISSANSDVSKCALNEVLYAETGDLSKLPLLCHYPVKAQYMSNDPDYINCTKKECKEYDNGSCVVTNCSGSLRFHVINIRTDIEFVFFAGGFDTPCVLTRSNPVNFSNPKQPLYGHLSSIDSTGTSMRVTWVSGDKAPQQVQYGDGKMQTSEVTTFSQDDMISAVLPSPAKDFGWHDPGYIHSAVMTGLQPSSAFSCRYGSDSVGWSDRFLFWTPPAGGSDELNFLVYGDMGKAPRDASVEHYIQPGSLSVIGALTDEVNSGKVDSIFHIGDISYATGFLVEWDFFLQLISPFASRVAYMTAIGNHERDYVDSGSVYITPDSGGECGVPYETYFPMPTQGKDKPWYSIEQASVHFTIISTEHDWSENSEQYEWMKKDMATIDRSKTPWLIFMGHRPMYTSTDGVFSVDKKFVEDVEPLLLENTVDLALFGHVHNYERTCAVNQEECKAMPIADENGIYTYDNSNYSAPVHAVIGMAGFTLDNFTTDHVNTWSLRRISKFGYVRGHATKEEMNFEFVNAETREIEDNFRIIKKQSDKFVDVSQIMSRFAGMAVDEFNTEKDVEL
ncbi:probable inactive purple acid phosphatase 27 [Corylus avellana]|uniref:probable inactive purple acid phosphatase 27 n=1 Tax=Corylus avellana TaxID=13451 RepID=UPI00286A9738|nr:probable inactive purple acid phosphatase 27 [Corylus avellana]